MQYRKFRKFMVLSSGDVGPSRQRHDFDQVMVILDNYVISQSPNVNNLGVPFDSTLSFYQHIKEITKIAFYHLRNFYDIYKICLNKNKC